MPTLPVRFAASIARTRQIAPESEACIESPTEIIFRLHGLEFARAKPAPVEGPFRNAETITFGLWPAEYTLDETKVARFRWSRASLSAFAPRATAAIRSSAFVRSADSKR